VTIGVAVFVGCDFMDSNLARQPTRGQHLPPDATAAAEIRLIRVRDRKDILDVAEPKSPGIEEA
jgi:hypothetical protein